MNDGGGDRLAADYLRRLDAALGALPAARREEIVEGIRDHIANARARHPDADVAELLDRLGTPEQIAAEATDPDRDAPYSGADLGPVGEWPGQVREVADLACGEAQALHHTWVGQDHLVLALLHPDCPGAARAVLESLGVAAAPLREAWVASMGDPFEPHHQGLTWSPALQLLLERARLEAVMLGVADAASEHVLLAVTGRWDGSFATGWLQRRGVDAAAVRRRVVELAAGGSLPEPRPAAQPAGPSESDPAPGLELAPTPDGADPRRRRPWGSAVFVDAGGRTFRQGLALRQYFVDRDGNPVLTSDGRPVHFLVDEWGNDLLDDGGHPRIGPVEIPPGCRLDPDS
jgi:HAAS/Clp amino terminal domain, pathogenicity island component